MHNCKIKAWYSCSFIPFHDKNAKLHIIHDATTSSLPSKQNSVQTQAILVMATGKGTRPPKLLCTSIQESSFSLWQFCRCHSFFIAVNSARGLSTSVPINAEPVCSLCLFLTRQTCHTGIKIGSPAQVELQCFHGHGLWILSQKSYSKYLVGTLQNVYSLQSTKSIFSVSSMQQNVYDS